MFFLLRVAFWLSLVILFIPADPQVAAQGNDGRDVSTLEAIGAANSTWQDVKGFCTRNPDACGIGRMALDTFSAKARTGARWVYEKLEGPDEVGRAPVTTGTATRSSFPAGLRPTLGWDAPLPPHRPIG